MIWVRLGIIPLRNFPIDGGQRLVLMRLNEGPILLISFTEHPYRTPKEERGMMFTDKSGKSFKGYGMYAALSYDEGKTWPVKRLLTDGTYRFLNGGAWTQFFEMDEGMPNLVVIWLEHKHPII